LRYYEALVEDTKASLTYFNEVQEEEETGKKGPKTGEDLPCEPALLYELDPATKLPQVSQNAKDIFNAVMAGFINPDDLQNSDLSTVNVGR
jgi:hypothetical protein